MIRSELHKHETTRTGRVTLVYGKEYTPQDTEYMNVEDENLYITDYINEYYYDADNRFMVAERALPTEKNYNTCANATHEDTQ